ncbi:MAG: PcfB family protein [Pseudobutyrivibrio sp.]|nr:PcfB family protein [Pseudobutyrivibrio sp.]
MKAYLEYEKQHPHEIKHGKMTMKELMDQSQGATSIEVEDSNIKSFEKVAKNYNVDFAVKKDKTEDPPKYMIFFKGKDTDVISQAFKEYVKLNERQKQKESVRAKLQTFTREAAKSREKQRERNRNKERGLSL